MVDECLAPFVYLHTCVYSCFLMCVCVCAIFVCVCYICVCVCVCVLKTHVTWEARGAMGWLRLVGSLNLWVSFAKEAYKRDYILQKRPIF